MYKNPVKITTLALVIIFAGAGCSKTAPVSGPEHSITPSTPPPVSAESPVYAQTFTIHNLVFSVPEKFSIEKVEKNKAYIKTEASPYIVYAVLEVEPVDLKMYQSSIISGSQPDAILADGEIYKVGCGGARACHSGRVKNKAFNFWWTIEGNQPVPKDLDGVWAPNSKITNEELLDILRTIQLEE